MLVLYNLHSVVQYVLIAILIIVIIQSFLVFEIGCKHVDMKAKLEEFCSKLRCFDGLACGAHLL